MTNQPKWQKAKILIPGDYLLKGKFIWIDLEIGLTTKSLVGSDDHEHFRYNCNSNCRGWFGVNILDKNMYGKLKQFGIHQFKVELQNKFRQEVPLFSFSDLENNADCNDLPSDEEESSARQEA